MLAVSSWPSFAEPEIVGTAVFAGASAATIPVAAETAEPVPALLVAVTETTSVEPTSAGVAVYVDAVAPRQPRS